MKFLCRALCVLFFATGLVRAAEDEDPETFGDYAPTQDDDLIQYVPKYTVRLGFRDITGVTSAFGAKGHLTTGDPGTTEGVRDRDYHDGFVSKDARTVADPSGRMVPITPDGRTNTWEYTSSTQVLTGDKTGLIAMHSYTADGTDLSMHQKDPKGSFGVELALERDIGNLLNSRLKWGVVAGVSINQFSSTTSALTSATITTLTDYYSLGGQIPPTAPYTAPQFAGSTDISVLLGNTVLAREQSTSSSTSAVLTNWRLRGAFMTFRAGPTLFLPIGTRFSANFSAGAVIVYSGSSYEATEVFTPATGDTVTNVTSDGESTLLPGFYVDASLQWTMTETSGLYVGGIYQSSGDYTQTITNIDGKSTYTTRVDLSKLQGFRAGVSFKF